MVKIGVFSFGKGVPPPFVCRVSVYRALAMACRRYPLSFMVRFCVS